MSDNFGSDSIDWDSDDDYNSDEEVAAPTGANGFAPPPVFGSSAPSETESVSFDEVERLDNTGQAPSIVAVEATGEGEHMTVVQIDGSGNRVTTTVDMALPPLDESEARDITEKIKGTTNLLYLLIKRAHAGKAYKALGYSSFEAYVNTEFNYSRSYAYKLLNQATVIEAIESVVPEGTEVYVGELTARGLKGALPELLEDIEERTAGATPEEASRLLEEAIRDVQTQKEAEDNFDEDYDSFPEPGGEFTSSGSTPMDYIDDDDESLDEFLEGDSPVMIVKRLEWLWNFLNGLKNFSDLSESVEISELLPLIPEERIEEVTVSLDENIEWLTSFKEKWSTYRETLPVSDNEEDEDDSSDLNFDDSDDIDF